MSNMSYCRFENTVRDLEDCAGHLHDRLSHEEARARRKLIELCLEIAEDLEEVDLDVLGSEADPDAEAECDSCGAKIEAALKMCEDCSAEDQS